VKFVVFALLMITTTMSYGHEYFFAFAEVEYNDFTNQFETTLIVSTHDLEKKAKKAEIEIGDLKTIESGSKEYKAVETLLTKHFNIYTEDVNCTFELTGIEVNLDGTSNFYFLSSEIRAFEEINFTFDLLMDEHPDQQNKATLYYRGNNYTVTFIQDRRSRTIKLENE
jgi:Domain of unknown function (DUF6702)